MNLEDKIVSLMKVWDSFRYFSRIENQAKISFVQMGIFISFIYIYSSTLYVSVNMIAPAI